MGNGPLDGYVREAGARGDPMKAPTSIAIVVACIAMTVLGHAQTVAVTGATVIDGTGKAPLSNAIVLITDGRIAAVGSAVTVTVPASATRIDARGKYVIPGLMDANLHLMLNIDLETLIRYEGRYDEIALE